MSANAFYYLEGFLFVPAARLNSAGERYAH